MIRMPTEGLVEILTDLVHTAADAKDSGATAGVLLHSARGEFGDEPGVSDLLVGTSTNHYTVGHTWTTCGGQAPPMLWPIGDVKTVLSAFKPKLSIKEHAVEIEPTGDRVEIREDTSDLFGGLVGASSVSFRLGNIEDWPVDSVMRLLATAKTRAGSTLGPNSPRTIVNAHVLAPFLKVASRRGCALHTWRWHPRLPVHVEIGDEYRGIVTTVHPDDGDTPSLPVNDVHPLILDGEDGQA